MKTNLSVGQSGFLLLSAALLATGCIRTPEARPTPSAAPALPGGLALEEFALTGPPALEPLTFTPVESTQEQIEARHSGLRENRLPNRLTTIDGDPAITAAWDGGTLTAVVVTSNPETQEMSVELRAGDETIFSAPAGFPSPATALQALWTYDGHWALEILLSTPEVWKGQLYVDGRLINNQDGYEEAFGSQLLGGKLFYFYQQDGRIGISYDGQVADLGYSQVPHYRCCSESTINPQQAEDMVAFFAEREGTWYYVELGRFD